MKCFLVDDLSGEIMGLDGFLINVIIVIINGNVFFYNMKNMLIY